MVYTRLLHYIIILYLTWCTRPRIRRSPKGFVHGVYIYVYVLYVQKLAYKNLMFIDGRTDVVVDGAVAAAIFEKRLGVGRFFESPFSSRFSPFHCVTSHYIALRLLPPPHPFPNTPYNPR